MMKLINLPLTELITVYPTVAVVLQSHHIDVREHSHTHLAQLLKAKSLARADFLEELQKTLITSVCAHYKKTGVKDLIHEIITRFHDPHRAKMHSLVSGARYIERKYAEHINCPQGLSALLIDFFNDLDGHMDQEELLLFPSLASTGDFNMFSQLAMAHHSHDRHINMMTKLKSITDNFTAPTDASLQWQELYENLLEFVLQLNMHIAIENQFLLGD